MIKYTTEMKSPKDKLTDKLVCETAISVDEYEKICKYKKSCFEVIPDDIPVCLYADIDCKHLYGEYEYLESHTNIFISYAKRAITKMLFDITPRFAIATSSNPDYMDNNVRKLCHSIHIHIPNVKMMKSSQKQFWINMNMFMNTHNDFKDWNEYISIDSGKLFDESVYNTNGKMRSVYCSKMDQNRPLILVEGSFKDTIISLGDDDAIIKQIDIVENPFCKNENPDFYEKCLNDDKIIELGNIIDLNYLDEYNDWTRIVWSLRSKSEKYKSIARDISKRSNKYDDSGFNSVWDGYHKNDITIGTFYNYCKMSNKSAYNLICTKYNTSKYISVKDLDDVYKCSQIIAPDLKNTLILCKENWYVLDYETQLWKKIKEPTYYIISEIRKYIDYSNAQIAIKMIGIDGEEKEKLILMQKEYLKYYTKINANGYISMCVKILRAQLVNDLFEDALDTMPNIMAFQNGIMDLKTKVFRYGIKGDDNLTDTIKYDWTPPNLVKTEFVKSVLKKILNNNEEHMEYYLSVIGYSFIGMPQLEKSLYFMIDGTDNGKGDNGKTFFFDIMNALMPYYVYKSKGSLLEEGNAKVHKQLCMTKGKRLVWLDEFSTKKTNAVLLKEIADGKTIENEVMFGTSESINILYKMFILSNHIPKVDPKEEAVYNRYKQISFGSHFDRSGNRKEENPGNLLFIADCYLSDKLKNEYYNEIFGLIIDYASKYYETKLPKIPEKFYKDAKETKMKNDEFGMWFDENCGIDDEKRIAIELLKEKSGFDDKLIKDGMKRMGFKYDKDMRGLGKNIVNKPYKGGFEGCFYKENNEHI